MVAIAAAFGRDRAGVELIGLFMRSVGFWQDIIGFRMVFKLACFVKTFSGLYRDSYSSSLL